MTAGGLLDELRALDLSTELHERIRDAIDRRKNLVHRTFEDPEPAKAINGGLSFDAVVERINRLAIDCGELAVELEAYAIPKLEKLLGKSRAELIEMVKSADPTPSETPASENSSR